MNEYGNILATGIARIEESDIPRLLRSRPGLIIGPGATINPQFLRDINQNLCEVFGVAASEDFFVTCNNVLQKGESIDVLRQHIREFVLRQGAGVQVRQLAEVRWSAILSASYDSFLKEHIDSVLTRRPTRRRVTMLDNLVQMPPPCTIPEYKLLGSLDHGGFACSTSTRVAFEAKWPQAIRGFIDCVKSGPVLCLGMSSFLEALLRIFSLMAENQTGCPTDIMFLKDDPIISSVGLSDLLSGRANMLVLDANLKVVANHIENSEHTGFSGLLPFTPKEPILFPELSRFHRTAVLVNHCLQPNASAEETNRLNDLLFSPDLPNWDPFAHNLDFRRSISENMVQTLKHAIGINSKESFSAILTGNSATGKTTVLKRIAYDLASNNELVIWLRPWGSPTPEQDIKDLFDQISHTKNLTSKRIAIFMDSPTSFSHLTPSDVSVAAQNANIKIVLILATRNSEIATINERSQLLGTLPSCLDECLSDSFDESEMDRLPEYLVSLGIYRDQAEATTKVQFIQSKNSCDVLCHLYWHLPGTRSNIQSSIREEYFDLGNPSGFHSLVLSGIEQSTQLLQEAYKMVAVANHLHAPLPIEVLVSALGVGYGDWMEAFDNVQTGWGILYSEWSDDGETICYRTRNGTVTDILIETINAGSLAKTGELAILLKLLLACTGSAPAYRGFVTRVLIPFKKLEDLEFEEGIKLYEAADNALPYPDRSLLHHKGLWIKNKGRDPLRAGEVLEEALRTSNYPHSDQKEPDEHIHTSIAATVIDAVKQKKISAKLGKEQVLSHLARARSTSFFNPNAVHVQANLVVKLAEDLEQQDLPDTCMLFNRALGDIDRTLLILQTPFRTHGQDQVGMLEQAKISIVSKLSTSATLKEDAEKMWNDNLRQDGFTLLARVLYHQACQRSKGSLFKEAYDYIEQVCKIINDADQIVGSALCEVAAHVYYKWRVRRAIYSSSVQGYAIEWNKLYYYASVVARNEQLSADPFYKYLMALSLSHMKKWADAAVLFSQLRSSGIPSHVLWAPRDLLLNEEGGMKSVQGIVKQGVGKTFLHVEAIQSDFLCDRASRWPEPGQIQHAYIRFSFAGPIATMEA